MKGLVSLFSDLIEAQVVERAQQGAKSAAFLFAATLLFVCGFVALMAAAFALLLRYMAPSLAALVIAALFLIAGGILLLIVLRKKPSKPRAPRSAAGALEDRAFSYVQENAVSASLLALLAGTAVGANPELKRLLLTAIDRILTPPKAPPPDQR